MRVIRARDCPEVAWKNGGGTTREIAVFPPDASMDDFAWRLSMARVDRAGAFSAFPGIDRVLAVIDGKLRLAGTHGDRMLNPTSAPFAFDGADDVTGHPVDTPVTDLNAMARRGAFRATMTRLAPGDTAIGAEIAFVIALSSQAFEGIDLDALDTVQTASAIAVEGPALHVCFEPTPQA